MSAPLVGTAYSYVRFSSKPQEEGDSVRRQTKLRDDWLAANPGVRLDALTLSDLGVSAYRGKNRLNDRAALTQFINAVERGKVKPGSFLIVESLDRLTREELGDAFELVLGLVNRGVRIVQLSPVASILEKPVNMTALMLAVVELSRANSESKLKSERIGAAWADKRKTVRSEGETFTAKMKAWCEAKNGKIVFKPGAKALVRKIFRMATDGHGCRAIARKLIADEVPTWEGKPWNKTYVRSILNGREVLGEFQMHRRDASGKRVEDGEPIKDYYPVAVTEAEWDRARRALAARTRKGGRPASNDFVGVFRGLLRDARTGASLITYMGRAGRVVKAGAADQQGRTGLTQFPYDVFERAVLERLKEVDPRELFDAPGAPDEVAELSATLARQDSQIRVLADAFDGDEPIPEVVAKLKAKNAERKATAEALDRAKANAASPLSSVWGETRGLVDALDAAKDQKAVRVRLRQCVARTVESVHALFVRHDGILVAGVQLRFAGSEKTRDYVIWYHSWSKEWDAISGVSDEPAAPEVRAELDAIAEGLGVSITPGEQTGYDFGNPDDLKKVEAALRVYARFFHAMHTPKPAAKTGWTPARGGWTEEEVAQIGTATDREVAERLGRTVAAVRGKRREMKKNGRWEK